MSEASVTEAKAVSAASLGGPGPADPQKCSAAALEALGEAVGAGMRLTSVQLDVSSKTLGSGEVSVRARVDKRTKSIAFASVEALAGEEMVFRAQALFGVVKV
jgi:acyl-coenzyme A thioesterase PaaI-like protein